MNWDCSYHPLSWHFQTKISPYVSVQQFHIFIFINFLNHWSSDPGWWLCSHQSLARLSFSYLGSQQPAGLIGFRSVFNGLLMLIHFVFTKTFYLWAIFGLSYNKSKNGLDSKKLICKIIPGIVGGCWWLTSDQSSVSVATTEPTLALLS